MKITLCPRLVEGAIIPTIQLPIESQYGVCTWTSFHNIVSAMKGCGLVRSNAKVIGIEIDQNGLKFVYED